MSAWFTPSNGCRKVAEKHKAPRYQPSKQAMQKAITMLRHPNAGMHIDQSPSAQEAFLAPYTRTTSGEPDAWPPLQAAELVREQPQHHACACSYAKESIHAGPAMSLLLHLSAFTCCCTVDAVLAEIPVSLLPEHCHISTDEANNKDFFCHSPQDQFLTHKTTNAQCGRPNYLHEWRAFASPSLFSFLHSWHCFWMTSGCWLCLLHLTCCVKSWRA